MKSVLASFKPQYCELIASGKKTVELRKTRPKLEVPFKVHMYCTTVKSIEDIIFTGDLEIANEKVIGEFVCDYIVDWDMTGESSSRVPHSFVIEGCLSPLEICEYAYKGRKMLRGWHISDLVIYDKPKELSEFYSSRKFENCHRGVQKYNCDACFDCGLTRPPQSWCYIEEV